MPTTTNAIQAFAPKQKDYPETLLISGGEGRKDDDLSLRKEGQRIVVLLNKSHSFDPLYKIPPIYHTS